MGTTVCMCRILMTLIDVWTVEVWSPVTVRAVLMWTCVSVGTIDMCCVGVCASVGVGFINMWAVQVSTAVSVGYVDVRCVIVSVVGMRVIVLVRGIRMRSRVLMVGVDVSCVAMWT